MEHVERLFISGLRKMQLADAKTCLRSWNKARGTFGRHQQREQPVALECSLEPLLTSPEKAPVRVLMDDGEGGCERLGLWVGRVAVPFEIGSLPEDAPDVFGPHKLHFGDGRFCELAGPIIRGPHKEELDGLVIEPLPLTDFVAQMQRRAAARPEMFFERECVFGEFVFGKGHDEKLDAAIA